MKFKRTKRRSFYVAYAYQNGQDMGIAAMDVSFVGPLKVGTIAEIQAAIGKARGMEPTNIIPLNIQAFER